MEAREKAAEDRAFGLKKTAVLSKYIVELLNDVRKELNNEDKDDEGAKMHQEAIDEMDKLNEDIFKNPDKYNLEFVEAPRQVEKMETDWSKTKKDAKIVNMPFLNNYKKSLEKQYGAPRSPRPDKNGYRNPPNRRIPDPES